MQRLGGGQKQTTGILMTAGVSGTLWHCKNSEERCVRTIHWGSSRLVICSRGKSTEIHTRLSKHLSSLKWPRVLHSVRHSRYSKAYPMTCYYTINTRNGGKEQLETAGGTPQYAPDTTNKKANEPTINRSD